VRLRLTRRSTLRGEFIRAGLAQGARDCTDRDLRPGRGRGRPASMQEATLRNGSRGLSIECGEEAGRRSRSFQLGFAGAEAAGCGRLSGPRWQRPGSG
jgi:hypothetical protein